MTFRPSVAGVRYDDLPLSASTTDNWVARAGGLPPFARAIVRALIRDRGMDESHAIATAINGLKHWAAGGGNVHPDTRARAAAAIAHWEASKVASHATKGRAAPGVEGTRDWTKWNLEHAGEGTKFASKAFGIHHAQHEKHPDFAKETHRLGRAVDEHHFPDEHLHASFYNEILATRDAQKKGQKASAAKHLAAATVAEAALRARGLAPRFGNEQLRDDMGAVGEGGSAGLLLPVGPPKRVASEVMEDIAYHRFKGSDLSSCLDCGRAISDPVHRKPGGSPGSGQRHGGPDGHVHASTGHIKGVRTRRTQTAKADHVKAQALIEGPMADAVQGFFADQRKAVISRLNGKRGKQMLKAAGHQPGTRSLPPPENPEQGTPPAVGDAGAVTPAALGAGAGGASAPDVSAIFDQAFWDSKLGSILQPYYDSAAAQSASTVRRQLELPDAFDDRTSLGAVKTFLTARGNMTSPQINQTTYDQIVSTLQQSVDNGEGLGQMTEAVNALFDQADRVRARRIAQTETIAALNGSSDAYANALPDGVVGSKEWQSHHDDRTRPEHRLADGQQVPVNAMFYVGGFPMPYPGFPDAPAHLVINCRCGVGYHPPGYENGKLFSAAKALHQQMATAAGTTLSAEAAGYLVQPSKAGANVL